MRKPTQPGTCATCNMEIFSWVPSPGNGRRMLANSEYRDISFKIKSNLPSNNGSSMRVGFCSECATKVDKQMFQEITENVRDGAKVDADRMNFRDESAKLIHVGVMLGREIATFCGCPPEDIQKIHSGGGLQCAGKKVIRRCCQHCWRMYVDGTDHAKECPVLEKDLIGGS